ncbi:MAG: TonB-dependent siderophore receptor [Pseudomonadota bacterium]
MTKYLVTVAVGALASAASAAYAQDTSPVDGIEEDDRVLDEIIVIGTDQSRYIVENTNALTGFELDFLELPRIVNVIPEQLILDQKITDLNEALRNTPGISQSDGFGGTNDDFFIRGFRRNTVYRNGFRRATNFRTNLTNVEYTQVVRGPAAITYGQVEPGGLVDVITKKPLDEQRISGEARFGSFDDQLFLLDVSQPVTDWFGVRVVASTQDANSFRDFTDIKRDTIAVSARVDPTPSTTFDIAYEFRDESRPLDRGTITVETGPDSREIINNLIDIPISRRFGEPFEIFESEFNFLEASLEQRFGDTWTARFGFAFEDSIADDLQARPRSVFIFDADAPISADGFFQVPAAEAANLRQPFFDDPTDLVFLSRRTDGSRERDVEVIYLDGILSGEFSTGIFDHRVAFGAEYRDIETSRFFVATPTTNGFPVESGGNGPLFNIQNPVFGTLPDNVPTDGLPVLTSAQDEFSFFFNDYVDLTDRLSILAGVRYDEFTLDLGAGELQSENAVSPQFGITYDLTDFASAFFSYSQAFTPNSAVNPEAGENEPFPPEDSEQFEIGAKAEFFDGKVQASGALYRINVENVLDFVDGAFVLTEGQSSQGVELSVTGQPIPGMNVVAGYAFTDAEIGTGASAGNRVRNVAENTFNIWTSYEVQRGVLEGLGMGGGVFFIGDRFGDNANTLSLGSYTTVDLSIWYTFTTPYVRPDSRIRVQFAARNLFDEEFFPASGGNERINIGTPQSFVGSISFDF